MVIYAVAAANEALNWLLEKCFTSIEHNAIPVLKEHSALESASIEMLNALEVHGQGCALFHYNPRQSSNQETKNEQLSANLNNA